MNQATRFQTEIGFTLPKGYIDPAGVLHRQGRMRRATAADEILPLADPRVQQNPAYLAVIVLARVVSALGTVEDIDPRLVERLFVEDFNYLQNLYEALNGGDNDALAELLAGEASGRARAAGEA